MHQPIPILDYSYNALPWRRRIRRCLSLIDVDRIYDSAIAQVNASAVKAELDKELDTAFWSPNSDSAYRNLRELENTCFRNLKAVSANQRQEASAKSLLLNMALDSAFAGVKHRCMIPRWKTYILELVRVKDGNPDRVFFTAEDNGHAFDWLLQAVLDQEDEILDEFKWGVRRLYHCPRGNPNRKIEITQEFWNHAYPIVEKPTSLF